MRKVVAFSVLFTVILSISFTLHRMIFDTSVEKVQYIWYIEQVISTSGAFSKGRVHQRLADTTLARLFDYASKSENTEHLNFSEWNAPLPNELTHSQLIYHPFSSCCSDPYPPLDLSIRQVLKHAGGFFIESGGSDGKLQSTTLALEKYFGWRGILIEPARTNIPLIQKHRNRSLAIHAGLVSQLDDGKMMSDPGGRPGGKSILDQGIVPARALSSLLDEMGITEVDFWSLDVEGFELPVLHGVDFNRHRPKYVVIEVWRQNKQEVFALMASKGYNLHPGWDEEGGISGFPKNHRHRDFLWTDSRLTECVSVIYPPSKKVLE